ncbi:MAG: VOC family protein [Bacteroidia bacterium]
MEILTLTLQTKDLMGTKKFYQDILGFQKLAESEKHLVFQVGSSSLIFELVEESNAPKYHFAFNIPINKMDEAISWAIQKVDLLENDKKETIIHFENWKAKAIYFFDTNRNIVELICREDLNYTTDSAFSAESIFNISEIGLVVDYPLQTSAEIIEKTNTCFFDKGPKREDFAALGTDAGLFVISNPHRNWYPTKDRAEKHKVRAKIKVKEEIFELEFH